MLDKRLALPSSQLGDFPKSLADGSEVPSPKALTLPAPATEGSSPRVVWAHAAEQVTNKHVMQIKILPICDFINRRPSTFRQNA
jgi:hypothetical protein